MLVSTSEMNLNTLMKFKTARVILIKFSRLIQVVISEKLVTTVTILIFSAFYYHYSRVPKSTLITRKKLI
jgi:hypothetical protein